MHKTVLIANLSIFCMLTFLFCR